ncbi:VanW family protein [Georgenia sp. Z1491]|uniref:VanW family protein n=1 Tax=Georgenia sp. Z1491 TaxID=3416707 RepID=UPI003CF7C724
MTRHARDAGHDNGRGRRRGRGWLIGLGITVVVLAGAYFGIAWFVGDKVPSGTVVAGVQIGGLEADEAVEELRDGLGEELDAPVRLTLDDNEAEISSAEAGLTFDAQGTVDGLTGFALDPRVLLGHFTGMGAYDPVRSVDEPALLAAIEAVEDDLVTAPVDGAIEFSGSTPRVTDPVVGTELDIEATSELVVEDWLVSTSPVEAVATEVAPEIDDEAVATAQSEIVAPLTSGPVTVQVGEDEVPLEVAQLTEAATIEPVDGALALTMDGELLADQVRESGGDIGSEPVDAQVTLRDGAPYIVGSEAGAVLDPEGLDAAVSAAATSTDDRVAVAEVVEEEAEFTTEDAQELGVEEVVSEISTPLTSDDVRTQNLVNGTALVTGTLVLPGEQFDLAEELGPITEENGFVSSGVVENGFNATALGGGVSQLSTNMFNVGWEAGLDDIEHRPHSKYFDRYPMGQEATLWVDEDNPENSINMIWENNTPYGVLVEAWVADGQVHTRLWSTEYWDVTTETVGPYNVTPPQDVVNDSPSCVPEYGGVNGFSVTVSRERSHGDEVLPREEYEWTYSPHHRVTCG